MHEPQRLLVVIDDFREVIRLTTLCIHESVSEMAPKLHSVNSQVIHVRSQLSTATENYYIDITAVERALQKYMNFQGDVSRTQHHIAQMRDNLSLVRTNQQTIHSYWTARHNDATTWYGKTVIAVRVATDAERKQRSAYDVAYKVYQRVLAEYESAYSRMRTSDAPEGSDEPALSYYAANLANAENRLHYAKSDWESAAAYLEACERDKQSAEARVNACRAALNYVAQADGYLNSAATYFDNASYARARSEEHYHSASHSQDAAQDSAESEGVAIENARLSIREAESAIASALSDLSSITASRERLNNHSAAGQRSMEERIENLRRLALPDL